MSYKYSGRMLREGRSWTDNDGIQHPASWGRWTDEEKAAKGVVWEDDPAPFDNRFYWGRDANGDLIPKSLDDVAEVDEDGNPILDAKGEQVITLGLRSTLIAKVKDQAGGLLQPTDWMIIRGVELAGKPPALEVKAYRQAIRDKSDQIETQIMVCGTIEDIIMLHTTPTDQDGNPTGNPPISDWPKA